MVYEETIVEIDQHLSNEILGEFISESRDHLDQIEIAVLHLGDKSTDPEIISGLFRSFHSFKGNSGYLNFIPVSELAHRLESLLDEAREGQLVVNTEVIEVILKGRDSLKVFVDKMEGLISSGGSDRRISVPLLHVIDEIEQLGKPKSCNKAPVVETPSEVIHPVKAEEPLQPQSIKVGASKLDSLVDLSGELLIAQASLNQELRGILQNHSSAQSSLIRLARISKEMQKTALSLRMIPIQGAFQKCVRVVHDLASKEGKNIQMVLEGAETELDRTIVDRLGDPLLHMVRNAVDHGIESPEKREALGKPAVGTLTIRASHRSGNVVIQVQDDGAGLNTERILAKAQSLGLVPPEAELTEAQIYELIFEPGFSTAAEVSSISGRGVGMDVVRQNIHELRGKVEIESVEDTGSMFTIWLPLTLAIIDGLVIRVGGNRYILPALSVCKCVDPRSRNVQLLKQPGDKELVQLEREIIPLIRLQRYFSEPVPNDKSGMLIVMESFKKKRCLWVDELLGKQEVVMKSLGQMFKTDPVISGGTILGDGLVALILDPGALIAIPL